MINQFSKLNQLFVKKKKKKKKVFFPIIINYRALKRVDILFTILSSLLNSTLLDNLASESQDDGW
jgi:hypothetical protein